jgi:hypothetical protein
LVAGSSTVIQLAPSGTPLGSTLPFEHEDPSADEDDPLRANAHGNLHARGVEIVDPGHGVEAGLPT